VSEQYIKLFDRIPQDAQDEAAFIRRHLTGVSGPVLDLGCGPGHWSADLHSLGADVTGVDVVPEFIAHARAAHPGPAFLLGSMDEVDVPANSVAGVLAWFSMIHLLPPELVRTLAAVRRLLALDGLLVAGFFDSDDVVAPFDHKAITAYRWPVDVFAELLMQAGFVELERTRWESADGPDRTYGAIAARAS